MRFFELREGISKNYDVIICGATTGDDSKKDEKILAPWKERGITWWLEDINGMRADIDVLKDRIREGPPK
ncbi:MAG: hypothetical protein ACTSSE_04300 [Candidatus Thorarchaeota archaeon]